MEEEAEEIKNLPGAIDSNAFFVSMVCGLGLAVALWVAPSFYSTNLVSDISCALRLIWVIECPIVIFLFNHYRRDAEQSSVPLLIPLEFSTCYGFIVSLARFCR